MPHEKNSQKKLTAALIYVAILFFAFGFFANQFKQGNNLRQIERPFETFSEFQTAANRTGNFSVIKVPAVDEEGNGVVTTLSVEAVPGTGKILVNIEQILFWVDTQFSIRVAERVAQNLTGVNTSNIDLTYAIRTNASVIEGESAGAALAIATAAALLNRTLNPEVMITGTVNPDGEIGPVGSVTAKAKAAKDAGAKTFLVPLGQDLQVTYEPKSSCEKIGQFNYCTTEYVRKQTKADQEIGVEIIEVGKIGEALKYFIEDR